MTEEKKGKIMNLKMLIYCTKAKPYLSRIWKNQFELATSKEVTEQDALNGKIVAECDFKVEEIKFKMKYTAGNWNVYLTPSLSLYELKERSCLNNAMLDKYEPNYAIRTKNLKIFDKPKELNAFYKSTNEFTFEPPLPLIKAPQNMMYVYDKNGVKYVLISVHPEWACKILNGEKTIEVRKKVLKEMIPCK